MKLPTMETETKMEMKRDGDACGREKRRESRRKRKTERVAALRESGGEETKMRGGWRAG